VNYFWSAVSLIPALLEILAVIGSFLCAITLLALSGYAVLRTTPYCSRSVLRDQEAWKLTKISSKILLALLVYQFLYMAVGWMHFPH
jgi:hypothetical protein